MVSPEFHHVAVNKNPKTTFYATAIKAFAYYAVVFGFCLGLTFAVYSGKALKGFAYGLIGGVIYGLIGGLYLLGGLILFDKKIFFYSNLPKQLQNLGLKNIYYESAAGNATKGRIKYGGLFLTDSTAVFIPHRFAIRPQVINLPLRNIKLIGKTGINLMKFFSGGLRKRLLIEMIAGERYEFSVWELNSWIENINRRIKTNE